MKQDTVAISFRVEPDLYEWLAQKAFEQRKKNGSRMSVAAVVRELAIQARKRERK